MEPLNLASTEDTPEVVLNAAEGKFLIAKRSLPEDSASFYKNIFEWLIEYSKSPNPQTIMKFNLEYFNTSSAKQIFKLFNLFELLKEKSEVKILWYYDKRDNDMRDSGERFARLCSLDFEIIEL